MAPLLISSASMATNTASITPSPAGMWATTPAMLLIIRMPSTSG